MIKAIIFDMDGTMVNTEVMWGDISRKLAAHYGITFDEKVRVQMMGKKDYESLSAFKEYFHLDTSVEELIRVRREMILFGRLAESFATYAKPSDSKVSLVDTLKSNVLQPRKEISSVIQRIPGFNPESNLSDLLFGVREKKLPKKWTNIPSVNFDGKVIEQNFTQVFEEKLNYKNAEGKWVTSIIQVPQKTDPTFWDEIVNKSDLINDIVDAQKARTAFGVNANHSCNCCE